MSMPADIWKSVYSCCCNIVVKIVVPVNVWLTLLVNNAIIFRGDNFWLENRNLQQVRNVLHPNVRIMA